MLVPSQSPWVLADRQSGLRPGGDAAIEMIQVPEAALRQIDAALRRTRARQAIEHARHLGVELRGACRQRGKLDVQCARDNAARGLGRAAYVDQLRWRSALQQRLQSRGVEQLIRGHRNRYGS